MIMYSKKRLYTCALIFVSLIMVVFGKSIEVNAAGLQSGPLIIVDKYEISTEKIIPGEDFTLTITLKNCTESKNANDVMIDITNPDGVAPVYGTVSQVFIGDINAGESVDVVLDYNSWTTITTDTLDFYVTVVTDTNQNYIVLRMPAGSDSPFTLLSSNTPEAAVVYEPVTFYTTFKVLGDENVSNVNLKLQVNGDVVSESVIGNVTSGTTKTQGVSYTFSEAGNYSFDFVLSYDDNSGQTQAFILDSASIKIIDNEGLAEDEGYIQNQQHNEGTDKLMVMGVSGLIILFIFMIIFVIIKKNK